MNSSIAPSTGLGQVQPGSQVPPQPSRWKMTLVIWLMVYPMITGLG